jgi:hypothetical protein
MKCSVLAGAGIAVALGGCSAGYMLTEYAKASVTKVSIGCRQPYSAYRRADNKVLIVAYPLVEMASCGGDRPGPLGVRYETAAIAYGEQANPPCRILSGRELDLLHSEFTVACGAPAPKPASKT